MNENRNESEFDLARLFFMYISSKLNFQHFLFFCVFVTFDVGDAVTAAMMIESNGIGVNYNMIVQIVFMNYGLAGLIAAKLCFIIIPLFLASLVIKRSYWLINGILVALVIFGLMAIQANLARLAGLAFMSPMEINLLYLKVLFILSLAGMIMDSYSTYSANQRFSIK